MIEKLELEGVHFDVTDDLKKYVSKKIGKLDQYMPSHAKKSARVVVKLKEQKTKQKTNCTCEVVLHLPKEVLTAKETTVNMFAAIDVAEEKLKNQIAKYKGKHGTDRLHNRILARMRRATVDLG